MKPKNVGHARSAALHVSRHGSSVWYADENGGKAGFRGVACASTVCSATTGTCAWSPCVSVVFAAFGGLSPQRGKETTQSQVR